MLKRFYVLFVLIIISSAINAQSFSIRGVLKNADNNSTVSDATLFLQSHTDSSYTETTISDTLGRFSFNDLPSDSFKIIISSIGFGAVTINVKIDTADVNLDTVVIRTVSDVLGGVTVVASVPIATQRGDTVQFNASQFKVNPDATAEELARKMPGITVENGQVKANGENVQRVTIDGRELFGDDATAALRNLPAEIIDKIQVFDRLSDQAQFTGVDDGNSTKGINIVTKASMRNGQFGRVFAGYGTDERYQAGGNTTFLKENRKISIVGNFNNINQQNFAAQDLLGVTNTNSQRGGGGGRGGRGQRGGAPGGGSFQAGPNAGNFLVGQQNGINKTNAAGINYSDIWGKKLTVTGSYFYNNTINNTNEQENTQYFLKSIPNTLRNTTSTSNNTNHRINMRFDYKIDSFNQIIFTPNLSFQSNSNIRNATNSFIDQSTGVARSQSINNSNSNRIGNNLNSNLLYRHSFLKKGRTFSINLNSSSNNRTGDVYNINEDTTFTAGAPNNDSTNRNRFTDQLTKGYQLSANLIYTEPIAQNAQLQFNYNPSYSNNKADQQVYDYDEASKRYTDFDANQSSRFDNTFKSQNAGIAYRYSTKDNQVSFGANYQTSQLESIQEFPRSLQVNKRFNNILPNAMMRYKLSTRSNIRVTYRAGTNQPSVNQLQDVVDITNQPFYTKGNPQLEQQYNHTVSSRYTYTNTSKGHVFVGNLSLQAADNFITNALYVPINDSSINATTKLLTGQQLSVPVNLSGYLNIRSFINFAFPVKVIKSNINFNGGVTYAKLPGIINNVTNASKNLTYTAGAVIASNVSQYIDFTVSYAANFNTAKNELQPLQNNNYFNHLAGVQFNLLSKQGWFLQNDLNNQLFTGLSAGLNQTYTIWNVAVGKKFLPGQKGELKLSVFDLLKQNQSISRTVNNTFIEDARNQVLQQYFMLTFSYNLRNFGGAAARTGGQGQRTGQGGQSRP